MAENKDIHHEGVVKTVEGNFIVVEILNQSSCSSSHAKGVCSMGDQKIKEVEVENRGFNLYIPGERVNVIMKRSLGFKALWISYVIPLIILLVLLLTLSALNIPELTIGISVIAAISLYYLIIRLLRSRLMRDFVFVIEKIQK